MTPRSFALVSLLAFAGCTQTAEAPTAPADPAVLQKAARIFAEGCVRTAEDATRTEEILRNAGLKNPVSRGSGNDRSLSFDDPAPGISVRARTRPSGFTQIYICSVYIDQGTTEEFMGAVVAAINDLAGYGASAGATSQPPRGTRGASIETAPGKWVRNTRSGFSVEPPEGVPPGRFDDIVTSVVSYETLDDRPAGTGYNEAQIAVRLHNLD